MELVLLICTIFICRSVAKLRREVMSFHDDFLNFRDNYYFTISNQNNINE